MHMGDKILVRSLKKRHHLGDLGLDGRTVIFLGEAGCGVCSGAERLRTGSDNEPLRT